MTRQHPQARSMSSTAMPHVSRCHYAPENSNDADTLEHVIMAINKTGREIVGCAYYNAGEELLRCVEDIEGESAKVLGVLIFDIQPTVLLISPGIDDHDINADGAERYGALVDGDIDLRPPPYQAVKRPSSDFVYQTAVNKLISLQTGSENMGIQFVIPGHNMDYQAAWGTDGVDLTDQLGKFLHLSGELHMESRVSIGCAGAVIAFLQRKRASEYLHDDPNAELAYRISRIEMSSLRDTMLVGADTLASLQVFLPESHPNSAKQGSGSSGAKESLSVYGLFHHHARTPQGKLNLRQMFLRPCLDIKTINQRLVFVECCVHPRNRTLIDALSKSLSHIKNIGNVMTNLRKGIEGRHRPNGNIKSGTWAAILEFCFHSIDISDVLNELEGGENLQLCIMAIECLDKAHLSRIGRMIHNIVDLDQSLEQGRTVIKRHVDEGLDQVKDVYEGIEDTLRDVARAISASMPKNLNVTLNVAFIPQLGFHIAVPKDSQTGNPVYAGDADLWERRFTTEQQVYFKTARMREMDTELGDLYTTICDAEIEISHDLAQKVLQDEKLLITASNLCGQLDCMFSLVHGAIQYNLTRPQVVQQNVIDVRASRHILHEMTVPSFIPNNAMLAGGRSEIPNMILMTGPNFSGKSVFLKQIATVVFMAQVGSFVPAESAVIGVTDKILTRITTQETVSKIQSAFMTDLQQITLALNSCTSRSLVVIDEFGKGTDVCDGAGLAAAVFKHILLLGNDAPKVLASTHFHEIFEGGRFDKFRNLCLAHMEVHVDVKKERTMAEYVSEVAYLYNLRPGRSTLSYGTQCAATSSIPTSIVDRAKQLANLIVQGEDLVAVCASLPSSEVTELEEAEMIARQFLATDLDLALDVSGMDSILENVLKGSTCAKRKAPATELR